MGTTVLLAFVTVIGLLIRISVAACATSVCGRTTVVSLAMFCSLMGLASRTHRFRRIVLIRRLRISTVVLVTRRHRRRLVRLITSASRVVSTTPGCDGDLSESEVCHRVHQWWPSWVVQWAVVRFGQLAADHD